MGDGREPALLGGGQDPLQVPGPPARLLPCTPSQRPWRGAEVGYQGGRRKDDGAGKAVVDCKAGLRNWIAAT